MGFAEYEAFENPLILTIRGKQYTIPPVSMPDGARLAVSLQDGGEPLNNDEFRAIILGGVWDELFADKVPAAAAALVMATALAEFTGGREAAEAVWKAGLNPKAVKPTPEAGASTTPRRASTSGTRKAGASRSVKSSNTGR